MKHKILKVIGITLGCILAFIGVVVGVMAIMGKFKKQNIAPTQLTFLENNFEVKNDYSGSLHSFMLTGTSDKGEVNQNDCYIYFISRDDSGNIYGEELITLCNENGEPLVSDNQGRYSIKCNEPTYYYFKPLGSKPSHFDPDNPRANKGKVVLEATSGRVYSDRLTFYVDMAVENIRFEGASTTKTSVNKHGREYQSQTVSVSLGSAWPLTYHIEPYYSLNPMAKRDENKVVELYYHTNETSTDINDYQLICREYKNERVFNQDFLSTHKFIEEIDGNVCFVPDGSQSEFEFIYAVFESYNEQEAHPESDFIYASDRVEQYMAYAVLNVSVESETISNVAINNPNIQLNLYYENNFITLNGSVSDADVNSNDLGLT